MTFLTSPQDIASLLARPSTVAVLGFHPDPGRAAHFVPEYLHRQGFKIIPVNPQLAERSESYFGHRAVATLAEIPGGADIVEVFRRSDKVAEHLPDILAMQPLPRAVWLQKGIRDQITAEALAAHGISVVQDRCMLTDHRSLT
ncbi:CoA-binding protein [Deinococcus lacus]|uniref:CoA-binding protein n=1 Tax=Deinococcus lacus TaxID=392561 RepID=A0ABW1Y9H2_9DEIO